MDPLAAIQTIISIIKKIKRQGERTSNNIKTCRLLASRCNDLITPLQIMEDNLNRENYRASLHTLIQVLNDCESFIASHGQRTNIVQFFSAHIISDEFKLLNDRLNASILNLNLGLQINDNRQCQEAQEVLNSDMNEIKSALFEIATANNFHFDRIYEQNESVSKLIQFFADNVHRLRNVVDSSSTQPASDSKFSEVDESQLVRGNLIGRGSYGDVYKCGYRYRAFALKSFERVFTQGGLNSAEVKKISREIQILKLCHHSNIISFVAATVSPEKAMIITELATCNLSTVIHDDSPIITTFSTKVRWLADVARGLRYLHFHHIIHRDLKPANILLVHADSAEGRELIVAKIADFGVSSAVGLTTIRRTEDKVEQVGTCAYDAPEVCDDVLYSALSDVYAWGITANELLTCAIPWAMCRSAEQIVRMVMQGKRPQLFAPTNATEGDLMRLVGSGSSGCLAQEPSQRCAVDILCNELSSLSASAADYESADSITGDRIKAPQCPVCLSEYDADRRCYLICSNGHSLCEPCKEPSTREGKCPLCKAPCLIDGGYVNRAVMDVVDAITSLTSVPATLIAKASSLPSPLLKTSSPIASPRFVGALWGPSEVSE